jgi:predicted extracellular nuclease
VDADNAVRVGDTTSGITGVLGFGFGLFRLQPTEPITFAPTNPRPPAPAPVGAGLRVATFNVANYFSTLGSENPNARGADSATELERQQAKLVAALTGLDADVVALQEVENNGATAIAQLVDALNAATSPGTYAFVAEPVLNAPNEFGGTFGNDAIKVAMIYQPAAVTPVGAAQSSADSIFTRPPLVQTFRPAGDGQDVTVVVAHLHSRSCAGATGAEEDQGDGQGCFNPRRVAEATKLIQVIGSLDVPNPLIVGDLGAYAQEDPVQTLEAAGYTSAADSLPAEDRYGFIIDAQSGQLSHALTGPSLTDGVSGATIWHINADEAPILDYNTEFKPPALYQPNEFRSSDQDPILLGIDVPARDTTPPETTITGGPSGTIYGRSPTISAGFSFTSSEQNSAFRCRLDGGPVEPCTSPRTYTGIPPGTHTFRVFAVDAAGNADPTPASRTFTYRRCRLILLPVGPITVCV